MRAPAFRLPQLSGEQLLKLRAALGEPSALEFQLMAQGADQIAARDLARRLTHASVYGPEVVQANRSILKSHGAEEATRRLADFDHRMGREGFADIADLDDAIAAGREDGFLPSQAYQERYTRHMGEPLLEGEGLRGNTLVEDILVPHHPEVAMNTVIEDYLLNQMAPRSMGRMAGSVEMPEESFGLLSQMSDAITDHAAGPMTSGAVYNVPSGNLKYLPFEADAGMNPRGAGFAAPGTERMRMHPMGSRVASDMLVGNEGGMAASPEVVEALLRNTLGTKNMHTGQPPQDVGLLLQLLRAQLGQ